MRREKGVVINRDRTTAFNSKSIQAEILIKKKVPPKFIIFPDDPEYNQNLTDKTNGNGGLYDEDSNDDLPF